MDVAITTGILIFDEVEELDFVGPFEVFGMARTEGDRLVTISERADPVRGAKGLQVVPDCTFADAPALDVLVVPGGWGTRREAENPILLDWIASVAPGCTWVTSVCTGAFVLHAAGVARGREVTTHWGSIDRLRDLPDTTVHEHVRYVRDGNVVTASGVSAGIDMALWLVGQLYGVPHARATQYAMQYEPAPPYAALV
jgi:transcriptional regulator GlxA family with amidase domain